MSYILDAMRKSERDRTLGEVRTVAPEQRRGPGRALLVSGITIGFVLIGLAIWYGWGQIGSLNNSIRVTTPVASSGSQVVIPEPSVARPMTVTLPASEQAMTASQTSTNNTKPASQISTTETRPPVSAPPTTVSSRVTISQPRDWRELPTTADVGEKLPETLVQQRIGIHVYDRDPAKRLLLINGRRYVENQTLTEGTVIEEITPDGVVLNHRGTRFHKQR